MPERAVRIEGLRELERAFKLYGRGLDKGLREAMEAGAEPVRADAQALALVEIPRISVPSTTVPWHRMRVGVTRRTAYVAPEQRGDKSRRGSRRRPNFATKLKTEAMEPALERNIPNVEREFDEALKDLARRWSRV
jgi:hypothetical protein